jgi:sugar phosphate isomerase/epimerase
MNPSSETPPAAGCSRREFLARVALTGAAASLASAALAAENTSGAGAAGATANTAASANTAAQTAAPCVHVFSKPLQHLTYAETAALLAECGYGGIDYPVRAGGHVTPAKVADDLPRAIEAAHQAGLKVEMITTDVVNARAPFVEPVLRTAAKHGVKFYRLGNFNYDAKLGVLESLDKHAATLKELAALNASLGLHGAIQNHAGTRVGSPVWDLRYLVRELDPQWIGVQYDIRHGTTEGGQSWPLGLKLLAPWIRCTDVKDFRWEQSPGKATIEGTPLGEGIVPLDAYYKLYRELGLGGPISVHLEYPPFEHGPKFASPAEQRAAFAAALKKDAGVLKGLLAKHRLA